MITPVDIIDYAIATSRPVEEVHYHQQTSSPNPSPLWTEDSTFHLVSRNLGMAQIGFDYYYNICTYRV